MLLYKDKNLQHCGYESSRETLSFLLSFLVCHDLAYHQQRMALTVSYHWVYWLSFLTEPTFDLSNWTNSEKTYQMSTSVIIQFSTKPTCSREPHSSRSLKQLVNFTVLPNRFQVQTFYRPRNGRKNLNPCSKLSNLTVQVCKKLETFRQTLEHPIYLVSCLIFFVLASEGAKD